MAIPSGVWKSNINGVETVLLLDPANQTGVIAGRIFDTDFQGFWDESTQVLKFQILVFQDPRDLVVATFTGHLFRTPINPEPGRDVQATLVGNFQMTPSLLLSLPKMPFPATGTARRNVFGWFAQISEIN